MLSNFASFNEFLQMGGYAFYVWPAYGIFIVVLLVQVIQSRLARIIRKIQNKP